MYGAILGDIIGAPYEFDRSPKTKNFSLFGKGTEFTDDSVMTIAVAEALMDSTGKTDEEVKEALISSMRKWGCKYPYAGYGGMFNRWLKEKDPQSYGSFGNGSAMRVSAAGWLYDTLEDTRRYARLTAEVTHNHPEGIKGAEVTASAIFLGRTGSTKDEIKEYIIREFHYDLSRTCDEIRPTYCHVETCQETVPEAVTAFLEGNDFEDVIRTAVSLGGDCDTLTCIAGSIAEAFYGVSDEMRVECRNRLQPDMIEIIDRFETKVAEGIESFYKLLSDRRLTAEDLEDGFLLKKAIHVFNNARIEMNLFILFKILRDSYVWVPCNAVLSDADYAEIEKAAKEAEEKDGLDSLIGQEFSNKDIIRMVPDILKKGDDYYFPIFTTAEDMGEYGERFSKIQKHFLETIPLARNNKMGVTGIVINAFSESFILPKELFDAVARIESDLEEWEGDR